MPLDDSMEFYYVLSSSAKYLLDGRR